MHINQESRDLHSIQAYSEAEVKINDLTYEQSLIVNGETVIADWSVKTISELSEETIIPLLQFKPKIIIIGSNETKLIPYSLIGYLGEKSIGIEVMNIGAACRTFNVLLSEQREVVLGLIF